MTQIQKILEAVETLERAGISLDCDEKTAPTAPTDDYSGQYVIVRGTNSGVFAGTYLRTVQLTPGVETIELADVRHLWYWAGANNTVDLSLAGVTRPGECKFTAPAAKIRIHDAVETLVCTAAAQQSLEAVPHWVAS